MLGGRWAASPAIWLVLFGPSSLLVIMQDTAISYRHWWGLPASAVAQHVGAGLVILGLVTLLRRFYRVIPVRIVVSVWILAGIVRGLLSGWLVSTLSTAEPEYAQRVLFWAAVFAVWLPLIVHTATQLDLHATITSSMIALRLDIAVEHSEADTSEREREGRLMSAVATALAPVIIEIRQSLEAALSESRRPLATISDKIESVVDNVLEIIVNEPIGVAPRSRPPRRLLAPLNAALGFDSSRPIFASVLVSVAAAALLVPNAFRIGGPVEAFDVALSIAASGMVTSVLLMALHVMSRRHVVRMWHVAIVLAISVAASVTVFLLTREQPLQGIDVSAALSIAAALVASALVTSAGVGLSIANLDAVPEEERLAEELAELRVRAAEREEATREQFTSLMHGPVLGRLSACVMALNFHAAGGGGTPASRAEVAAQVIAHLDLVAADLEEMAAPRESVESSLHRPSRT